MATWRVGVVGGLCQHHFPGGQAKGEEEGSCTVAPDFTHSLSHTHRSRGRASAMTETAGRLPIATFCLCATASRVLLSALFPRLPGIPN